MKRKPNDKTGFWFPAKRHGWGWGPPVAWQGWVVLIAYLVLMILGAESWRGHMLHGFAPLYFGFLTVIFVAIVGYKGE